MRQHSRVKLKELDRKLESIIKRYGKVRLTIQRIDSNLDEGTEYGTRILHKSGYCEISYSCNSRYKKTYGKSCFFGSCVYNAKYTENGIKIKVKDTLKAMRKHDGKWLKIVKMEYGPYYRIKRDLCK